MTVIQVFADVGCPFTHVGLLRFVERRRRTGRDDVRLHVRSWPLELVNGKPLDPHFIAEEVDEIRDQIGDGVFAGFAEAAFPSSSIPPMALAAAAYRRDVETGEAVSLELRRLCFEAGVDIGAPDVLAEVAAQFGVEVTDADTERVHADLADGRELGVIGSPHFFTPAGGFFCPALDVSRNADGHLRVLTDTEGFDRFIDSCFT